MINKFHPDKGKIISRDPDQSCPADSSQGFYLRISVHLTKVEPFLG